MGGIIWKINKHNAALYEKAKIYQKDNSEKINKYNRIKNKTRISIKELRERNIQWNTK